MKTIITEHSSGLEITLQPENIKEVALLLRYSRNVKSEKATVHLSFVNEPYCYIYLPKRQPSAQKNYIKPIMK